MVLMRMLSSHNLPGHAVRRTYGSSPHGMQSSDHLASHTTRTEVLSDIRRDEYMLYKALFNRRDVAANPQTRSTIEERTW